MVAFMPSAFEPCGLSQMMSMRYGTCQWLARLVVRDTVEPYNPVTGSGTGSFATSGYWMVQTLESSMFTKTMLMLLLKQLQHNAMTHDSWDTAAIC